ncbi:hypothetical protein [Aeromonas phage phiA014S]|uniref:Uncharacterized protein n=1 Tax=Aeromonas phage phiA014S TaxID=3119845 RepID=A0ABZ2CLY3_9CAUD
MAQSNTTDRLYYFARRKDTGMAGVWFTHCAPKCDQSNIACRLLHKAHTGGHTVRHKSSCDALDAHFPVGFLEDNFVATVKEFCKGWDISIAADLTMAVLRENGVHNIERLP